MHSRSRWSSRARASTGTSRRCGRRDDIANGEWCARGEDVRDVSKVAISFQINYEYIIMLTQYRPRQGSTAH